VRAFRKLVVSELRITVRDVPVSLVAVAFPAAVVAVFGAIIHPATNTNPIRFFFEPLALAMGIGVLAFSLMATEIATYREKGILRRLAVTPVSPYGLLGAQLIVNLIIAVGAIIVVMAVGRGFGFPFPRDVPGFLLAVVLGLAALLSVGLFFAAVAPAARVATGMGVSFYFVNLIFGGIFVPRSELPSGLARIGDFVPLGAFLQSLQNAWQGVSLGAVYLIVLAAWAIVCGALAVRTFRWE
jgi:ABC-2 type transport system permease protein